VSAIEESHSAVQDAAVNTEGIANIEYHEGKVEDVLPALGSGLMR
jgi:hypothetical protein